MEFRRVIFRSLSVPFVLGLNGNAITVAPSLAAGITGGAAGLPGAVEAGKRFAAIIAARAQEGAKVRMGVVHRYSSHHYMLRYWLASSGVDVDKEVEIVPIARPFAADALAAGEVDGVSVGEPWNSVAVDKGVGAILPVTSFISLRRVGKVLAMRQERME